MWTCVKCETKNADDASECQICLLSHKESDRIRAEMKHQEWLEVQRQKQLKEQEHLEEARRKQEAEKRRKREEEEREKKSETPPNPWKDVGITEDLPPKRPKHSVLEIVLACIGIVLGVALLVVVGLVLAFGNVSNMTSGKAAIEATETVFQSGILG